ncbi:hypothetical protein WH47_01735 [Habropoda laboriosa]|uniref:Uncharacterized protein n=1 Tax=Habropoda laboriosa TaxID=597456 RepID=A0A0L7RJE3_9HYME|nr:PREDICTED: uncharacterized protein LOC108579385 [Habropoda laboriosa]KOC71092.1 hypothetical protein WH47_01735 [Habropoda laboriosa]
MSLFVMRNFYGLTLFIWLVSILTLSNSNEIKTDRDTFFTPVLNASFIDGASKIESQTLSSLIESVSEFVNSSKSLNKNVATPSVAGEGGPISITSTISYLTNIVDNLDIQATLSKEENIPYVKRRKNTSKIVSRKGANEMLDVENDNISSIEVTLSNDTKPVIESSTTASVIHSSEHIDMNANSSKSNITDKNVYNASNDTVNTTLNSTNVSQKLPTNVPATASVIQEHKPKPTATVIDEPNSDKQAFIPHIKGSRLGMPKKIDYVLPVIVTLIALPVLGAIIFMVYKQGRDCWDKRHYKRMDFLIDGMYND